LSITKLGVIGAAAALLLAFGAFGLSKPGVVTADISGVTANPASGGEATVTVGLVSGGQSTQDVIVTTSNGVLQVVNDGTCTSVDGDGTDTVTFSGCAVGDSMGLTNICASAGTYTVAASQGTSTDNDSSTCDEAGAIGVVDSVEVDVENSAVTGADITTLETNPVGSNVSNADITITAEDENGVGVEGVEVLAIATTGVIETAGGVTVSSSGTCSQTSDPDDTDVLHEEVNTDADGEAVFTYCASVGSTLGPTTITFIVVSDTAGEPDFIETVSFTIVGPPASLTLTVSPTTLVCGEKATITGTVKDAIGQNVSNGTGVSLFTNFGGVAIGTSSGGGNFGGVATASTSSGNFNGFLLTSTTNTGPYEVVAQVTGAAGQAIFTQQTVTCRAAAAAPTVTAPSTGTGTISPPSTGDAGLLSSSESDASLYVVAGMVAFVLAGFASLRFARR